MCALFEHLRTFWRKLLTKSTSVLLVETIDTALLVPVPAQLFVEVSYGYILTVALFCLNPGIV